jgi:hypothetical protein
MMNPSMYFREAERLDCEKTDLGNSVQRRSLIDRPLFSRVVLPTGCILYQLVRYRAQGATADEDVL